jgi:alkylated DNA repair dioxygenase AlkB
MKQQVPRGLYYIDNAFDNDLADLLNEHFATANYSPVGTGKNSRKVLHYGYKYDYATGRNGGVAEPFPECIGLLQTVLRIQLEELGIEHEETFDQCIVNQYLAGQGIGAHTDSRDYGAIIGCFTLPFPETAQRGMGVLPETAQRGMGVLPETAHGVSPGMMEFELGEDHYSVTTNPRSLYIMSGDARYQWKHSMVARKSDYVDGKSIPRCTRVSVTFRSVVKK